MTEDELTDKLKEAQRQHLTGLEAWAQEQERINGVPVIQALTYELIQTVNHVFLNDLLKPQGEEPTNG
jgi:uncharacterized protein YqhQ